jgi:hypothetical protein
MNCSKQFFQFPATVRPSRKADSQNPARQGHLFARLLSVVCLLSLSATLQAQEKIGADVNGIAAYDESGWSVTLSSDGQRLAVGARTHDGAGIDSGHVRVYQWSLTNWDQLGDDIDGEAAYDESGYSVSLSADGNRLAIGAPGNDGNGFDSGHVRVYQYSNGSWTQLGNDIDGEAAYDGSGSSVTLSRYGNRVAIGAPGNDANGFDSGHVRVYELTGANWLKLGDDIDGEAAYDGSGTSVSLASDGGLLAIGADGNDGTGIDAGHVRVYQLAGQAWLQRGDDIDGEAYGDHFGSSVSLSRSGNRLTIGAPFNINGNGTAAGHVRVFEILGTIWTQLGNDIDGEADYDESGSSVSLSADGNRLVIGAHRNDGGGLNSGHARVYQWSNEAWTQLGVDIDGEAPEDASGNSVSLASNGDQVAIGANLNDDNGPDSGHARVYDLSMFNIFKINPGLNDAWYYPATDGQGFFITVFPDLEIITLAWFTYDTELPPEDAQANLGDAGHRWLTASGPINGDHVLMNIEMTSGGIFDTPTDIKRTEPPGSDGTILLTFHSCNSGVVEYDIPSINQKGTVPIQRVAGDNIVLCEALGTD